MKATTFDKPLLLDANALLNAVFLPHSFSAHAVALVRQQTQVQLMVSAGVLREARHTLAKFSPDDSDLSLAWALVRTFLETAQVVSVDDDDTSNAPASIPKSDRHVFHAARRHDTVLLTSDAALWLGCREHGVTAFLPVEVIRALDGFSVQTTLFGVTPTSAGGAVFARLYPGTWAGCGTGRFTVIYSPGAYWVYYDASQAAWVAQIAGLSEALTVKANVAASQLQTICLTWRYNESKRDIVLKVAGVDGINPISLPHPPRMRPTAYPMVGSAGYGQHCWNGNVYFCVSNDAPLSLKAWKKYQRHRDLTPNPYDAHRLQAAVEALSVSRQ